MAGGQGPIANDPFQSVPAPQFRPRPAPRPSASGYPVPVGQSFRDCAECPELVVIPAGSFEMGSPSFEDGRSGNEGPQRTVRVSGALAVGKFEVTFSQWDACVSSGGCSNRPDDRGWGRDARPVINVSWDEAQQYVRWLSGRTGKRYRLLTEAEWEYAARGRSVTPFSFGATISPDQANYDGNYTYGGGRRGVYRQQTVPVGSFPANNFALHDMHGNVWEWVEDCYGDSYAGAPSDASVPVTGGTCSARVRRGGSWGSTPLDLRSAYRYRGSPGLRVDSIGFRVARTPGG
jgi:formylglycine-generating enzyme required for sulfatase activity